jgi:Protein of unknown function (DUF3296).
MKLTSSSHHNGLHINANANKGTACIIPILDKYKIKMFSMVHAHGKIMQVRFDLRYPDDGSIIPIRQHIYDFNYNLKRKLQREKVAGGHLVDPQMLWTEERHTSLHPHYHYVLLVNGNAKEKYFPLLRDIVEPTWKKAIRTKQNGLVDYCDKHGPNGLLIIRNSPHMQKQINQCSHQASYIAKVGTKEHRGKGHWLMGGSRHVSGTIPQRIEHLDLFG